MGGERAPGIRARLQDLPTDTLDTAGDIRIAIRGGSITTHSSAGRVGADDAGLGNTASGIEAYHSGITGDIRIDVQDATIRTEGTAVLGDQLGTLAHGIYALYQGTGNIDIDASGGSITTKGPYSYGIYATHSFRNAEVGDGHVAIDTHSGHTITTEGANAHGIVAYHYGTKDSRSMAVAVGGSINAKGVDAQGVRVGVINVDGDAERVAGMGADGYRKQTVTVNGRVQGGSGEGAGVFLAAGGKVYIGPQGTVGAESGIAIRASGGDPRLLVAMDLDGRRVAEVIGDDWIINDGGETTIVVNGVMLHDGATGVVLDNDGDPAKAANGAFDVWIRQDGLTVDTSTDPWTVSERTEGLVTDRDFSAEDFEEALQLSEEYAPRSALYEALPGALLRLNGRVGNDDGRVRSSDSAVWLRLDGGTGSYEAKRSTVGGEYDFDRFVAEVGIDVTLTDDLTGLIAVRTVSGSADVSSPVGGGEIGAWGHGLTAGLAWHGADGFYGDGRLSATWYDLDLTSDSRGSLQEGADAFVHAQAVEAGRRFAVSEKTELTARTWLHRSEVSVDDFTDAAGARVSISDGDQLKGGVGGVVETDLAWDDGEEALTLHGSLDVEQTLDGGVTSVLVSGTELKSEAPATRALLGVGATYRWDRYSLQGGLRAHGPGSGDTEYSGSLLFRMAF